jgi:hypothetical protein
MSTITGLISAGGGGGGADGIIRENPNKIPRFMAYDSYIQIKRTNSTSYITNNSSFWSTAAWYPEFYTGQITAADTYVTVADITSATNGGYLYNVFTPECVATGTPYIKITVDGTAYEYSATQSVTSSNFNFRLVWGILMSSEAGTTTDYRNYDPFSTYNAVGVYTGNYNGQMVDLTNHVSAAIGDTLLPFVGQAEGLNLPRIYFESSLKVEVKSPTLNGTNEQTGLATIQLL